MLHIVVLRMEDHWILDANQNDVRLTEGEKFRTLNSPRLHSGGRDRCAYGAENPTGTSNDID